MKIINIILIAITLLIVTVPTVIYAEGLMENIIDRYRAAEREVVGETVQSDPMTIVAEIIKVVLGFLGIVFVVIVLYSGFQWMTAGGNADIINKARQRIINAVIGLVIVLGVFMITEFILETALSSVA